MTGGHYCLKAHCSYFEAGIPLELMVSGPDDFGNLTWREIGFQEVQLMGGKLAAPWMNWVEGVLDLLRDIGVLETAERVLWLVGQTKAEEPMVEWV